jgi:hypothetical protein
MSLGRNPLALSSRLEVISERCCHESGSDLCSDDLSYFLKLWVGKYGAAKFFLGCWHAELLA